MLLCISTNQEQYLCQCLLFYNLQFLPYEPNDGLAEFNRQVCTNFVITKRALLNIFVKLYKNIRFLLIRAIFISISTLQGSAISLVRDYSNRQEIKSTARVDYVCNYHQIRSRRRTKLTVTDIKYKKISADSNINKMDQTPF